jgi:hypothetical protein
MRRFGIVIAFALLGAVLLGAFMFFATLVLGHVRPMWMDFDRTGHFALLGLAVGALAGVATEYARSRERDERIVKYVQRLPQNTYSPCHRRVRRGA